MASSTTYAKSYANRRAATATELYNLILFPADNSIAVVKSKQCSPSEQDGFQYVQSGRRKFTGVVLEEGKRKLIHEKDRRRDGTPTIRFHSDVESMNLLSSDGLKRDELDCF